MKYIKLLSVFLLISLVGCEDKLDILPDGSRLTEDQVKNVISKDATKLQSEINGLYSFMKAYPATGTVGQTDFGVASIAWRTEHNGPDLVSPVTGYNWYSGDLTFQGHNFTYTYPRQLWLQFYTQIATANSIIAKIDRATDDPTSKSYLGQALAIRAYDYFNLAQLFQFTYINNKNNPCVPLITEETELEDIVNNPRATVEEVYTLIMQDLDDAITYLTGSDIPPRPNESAVNLAVAYGIRARVNLVMQNWSDAASDAENALTLSGEAPMSMDAVSRPAFYDATVPGVLWGLIITAEDDATQSWLGNYTGHCVNLSFGVGGYCTVVGTWKKVSKLLYDTIPATDVRKGWCLDNNYESPNMQYHYDNGDANELLGPTYDPAVDGPAWYYLNMPTFTSVKFGVGESIINTDNSNDWILMRASEMELIKAEAKAMGGNLGGGQSDLETWVNTYRDPDFISEATTAEELQDEIWLQRRMEFWGEGITWYDHMRLEKDIVRYEERNGQIITNFGANAIFNIPADAPYRIWPIPQNEIQANDGISDADNNNMGTLPQSLPVPGGKKSMKEAFKNVNGIEFNKRSTIGFKKAY